MILKSKLAFHIENEMGLFKYRLIRFRPFTAPSSSMERGQRPYLGFKKLRKYEIVKIDMLHNPNGAMKSIMHVLDDFTGFG